MLQLKKACIIVVGMAALLGVSALPGPAAAGIRNEIDMQMDAAGGTRGAGLERNDPRVTVGIIISIVLGLVGIVLLAYMVYAGYLWMTAGGNDEQISTAKSIIRNCIIGLAIVLSAYSITWFVARVALGEQQYQEGEPVYILDRIFH